MLFLPHGGTVANETKTSFPSFTDSEGKINNYYMKELSDWFDNNFGLRNFLIGTQHRIVASVFGESSEKKVVLGKDGWLFYEETLGDFEGTSLMSEREIYSASRTLELMDEYCRDNGMKFAFVPVPNKNTLYPEKMPLRYPRYTGKSNMDMIMESLENTEVLSIDIKKAFENEKVLYRRTDSHWTTEGAGLASDLILEAIGKDHDPVYGSKTVSAKEGTGDLYDMLYVWGEDYDRDEVYQKNHRFRYARPIRSFEDNFINTLCDGKENGLYMFRDSFGNTLHTFLADEFSRCTFSRILPYNLVTARGENPDFVVVELVERNLRRLITEGGIFPAPERDIPKDESGDITSGVQLDFSQENPIDGFVRIEGVISENALPDATDNILIISHGTAYEATPQGENSFCAYIPRDISDNLHIFLTR